MPTIGVSIPVPEPDGTRLQEYRVALGDRSARQIPTHITLLPPYVVDEQDLPQVDAHLAQAATGSAGFRVHLRGTGTFRPVSPVVFVVVVDGISGCEQLAAAIRTGPLSTRPRFPYHPHVTVAQEVDDALLDQAFDELSAYELVFDVDAFHLYTHDAMTGWEPVRAYRLGTRSMRQPQGETRVDLKE